LAATAGLPCDGCRTAGRGRATGMCAATCSCPGGDSPFDECDCCGTGDSRPTTFAAALSLGERARSGGGGWLSSSSLRPSGVAALAAVVAVPCSAAGADSSTACRATVTTSAASGHLECSSLSTKTMSVPEAKLVLARMSLQWLEPSFDRSRDSGNDAFRSFGGKMGGERISCRKMTKQKAL